MILRPAGVADADAVGALHAASWRAHYRGAYADAYLDGDLVGERCGVWRTRLADPRGAVTVLAEDAGAVVGFVHVVVDDDPRWGSLVDNLHVTSGRRGSGIGTALHAAAVAAVLRSAGMPRMYLWVLEQNTAAQRFYAARGGRHVETVPVGGDPARLNGAPNKQRIVWDQR